MTFEGKSPKDRLVEAIEAPSRFDPFKKSVIADDELTGEQYVELKSMTGRGTGRISRVIATA